jgi:hypothetical protein
MRAIRPAAAPPSVTDVFVCTSATPRARAKRARAPASRATAPAIAASPPGDIDARRSTASGRTSTSTPAAVRSSRSSPSIASTTSGR